MRGNLFTLNFKSAKQAVETLPWVRTASLSRAGPHTLLVRLEEQVPLAKWGKHALINIPGERFAGHVDTPLPDFIGPEGNEGEMAKQYRMFVRVLEPIALTP